MEGRAGGCRGLASASVFMDSECHGTSNRGRFKIRVANRHDLLRQAQELLNDRYARRGYPAQTFHPSGDKLTLVAYEDNTARGTLTVQVDAGGGLLCDGSYANELNALRAQGHRLCEFIRLATLACTSPSAALAALFQVAFIYAHELRHCSDAVIEVNPRHVSFYVRLLNFEQIGTSRSNPRVGAPGVLLRCRLAALGSRLLELRSASARQRVRSVCARPFSEMKASAVRWRLLAQLFAKQE